MAKPVPRILLGFESQHKQAAVRLGRALKTSGHLVRLDAIDTKISSDELTNRRRAWRQADVFVFLFESFPPSSIALRRALKIARRLKQPVILALFTPAASTIVLPLDAYIDLSGGLEQATIRLRQAIEQLTTTKPALRSPPQWFRPVRVAGGIMLSLLLVTLSLVLVFRVAQNAPNTVGALPTRMILDITVPARSTALIENQTPTNQYTPASVTTDVTVTDTPSIYDGSTPDAKVVSGATQALSATTTGATGMPATRITPGNPVPNGSSGTGSAVTATREPPAWRLSLSQTPEPTRTRVPTSTPTATATDRATGIDTRTPTVTPSTGTPDARKEGAASASFTVNPESGAAPLTVTFNNTSTGAIEGYRWDFNGDGKIDSTEANPPPYEYSIHGSYNAFLFITTATGDFSARKRIQVSEDDGGGIQAELLFSASPRRGVAPLRVTFANESTGNITDYRWDFNGDGVTDSTAANPPPYTYTTPGTYYSTLRATGPGGTTPSHRISIVVESSSGGVPVAAFAVSANSGVVPLTVAFANQSSGNITQYSWDFNSDGVIDSTQANPSYTYRSAGAYTVTLWVSGPGGTSSPARTGILARSQTTPTTIPTPTLMPSIIPSHTPTVTATPTASRTATATSTSTTTATYIPTLTTTASSTPTHTLTPSHTPTVIATATASQIVTATNTPTATASNTPMYTATSTATTTATFTATPSATSTRTATLTVTSSPTWTATASPSPTPTLTATGTATATPNPTSTATITATQTASATPGEVSS